VARVLRHGQAIDYGMDRRSPERRPYRTSLTMRCWRFRASPSSPIWENLFDPSDRIYVPRRIAGTCLERPAVRADLSRRTPRFQINAGLRIRGGFSRQPATQTRLPALLRGEYGELNSTIRSRRRGSTNSTASISAAVRTTPGASRATAGRHDREVFQREPSPMGSLTRSRF